MVSRKGLDDSVLEGRQRTKNTLTHVLKMTEKEARQVIAELAADFIANPYNLKRDLTTNQTDFNPEFDQAVSLLGSDWGNELYWTVTAEYGDITATA